MTRAQAAADHVLLEGVEPEALGLAECERFLIQEARLLDEARFDEWLALFTADA